MLQGSRVQHACSPHTSCYPYRVALLTSPARAAAGDHGLACAPPHEVCHLTQQVGEGDDLHAVAAHARLLLAAHARGERRVGTGGRASRLRNTAEPRVFYDPPQAHKVAPHAPRTGRSSAGRTRRARRRRPRPPRQTSSAAPPRTSYPPHSCRTPQSPRTPCGPAGPTKRGGQPASVGGGRGCRREGSR